MVRAHDVRLAAEILIAGYEVARFKAIISACSSNAGALVDVAALGATLERLRDVYRRFA